MILQTEQYMERIKALTTSLMALQSYDPPELSHLLDDFRETLDRLSATGALPDAHLMQYADSIPVIGQNIRNGLCQEAYLALFINTNNLLQELIRYRQNA